jgi:hypothetical protein
VPRLGAGGSSRCKPEVLHLEDGAIERIYDGTGWLQFLSSYDGTKARYIRTGEIHVFNTYMASFQLAGARFLVFILSHDGGNLTLPHCLPDFPFAIQLGVL